MRTLLILAVLWAAPAFARCGDQAGDADAIATVRDRVAKQCDCASAFSHGSYVRCASAVVRTAVGLGDLRSQCRSTVVRCASKSTCGRPGAVICRRTRGTRVRCGVKRDATHCRGTVASPACAVAVASCCDASSCDATTTTSAPSTTTSTFVGSTSTTTTTTIPGPPQYQLVFTTAP